MCVMSNNVLYNITIIPNSEIKPKGIPYIKPIVYNNNVFDQDELDLKVA